MKKCPACDKTFEDSMRFCQVDGTPLVEDEPDFDPFATIVGVAPSKIKTPSEPAEPSVAAPEESPAISEPSDRLPESDPLATMYVSDEEMQSALKPDGATPESGIVEIQPIEDSAASEVVSFEPASEPEPFAPVAETPAPEYEMPTAEPEHGSTAPMPEPEPPSFNVPNVPAPSFGDISPPPSPFSSGTADDSPVSVPSFENPASEPKPFNEAETVIQPGFPNPFDAKPQAPVEQWTPPPAPEPSWENQQVGSDTPFQPPAVEGASGQNKTLPIISLVLGILSLCCYVSPITGLAAVITGFIGMKNANNSPDVYGGKGLAIAGMVTGGLLLVLGLVYWIFLLFFGGMAMIMDATR